MSGSSDGTIRIWHPATGKKVGMDQNLASSVSWRVLDARGLSNSHLQVTAVAADASDVVAGDSDGAIHWFNTNKSRALKVLRDVHDGAVIAILNCEETFVSVGGQQVVWWDLVKKEPVHTLTLNGDTCETLAACKIDKEYIGISLGNKTYIVNVQSKTIERTLDASAQVTSIAYCEGQLYIGTKTGKVEVWWGGSSLTGIGTAVVGKEKKTTVAKATKIKGKVYTYEELLETGDWKETRTGALREIMDKDVKERIEKLKELQRPTIETQGQTTGVKRKAHEVLEEEMEYCPKCGLKLCVCGIKTAKF